MRTGCFPGPYKPFRPWYDPPIRRPYDPIDGPFIYGNRW